MLVLIIVIIVSILIALGFISLYVFIFGLLLQWHDDLKRREKENEKSL